MSLNYCPYVRNIKSDSRCSNCNFGCDSYDSYIQTIFLKVINGDIDKAHFKVALSNVRNRLNNREIRIKMIDLYISYAYDCVYIASMNLEELNYESFFYYYYTFLYALIHYLGGETDYNIAIWIKERIKALFELLNNHTLQLYPKWISNTLEI